MNRRNQGNQSTKYFIFGVFFLVIAVMATVWVLQQGINFSRALIFLMFYFLGYAFIKNSIIRRRQSK